MRITHDRHGLLYNPIEPVIASLFIYWAGAARRGQSRSSMASLLLELALGNTHHGLSVASLSQSLGDESFPLDGFEFLLLSRFSLRRLGRSDPGLVSLVLV